MAFHQAPLGQRLLELQPAISRESNETGQRWGAEVGTAVGEELAREGVAIQPGGR
jgi:hypothetical protein